MALKRNEIKILKEVSDYIETTAQGHYNTDDNIQTIDLWESMGTLSSTSRDTAIKYLMRFGKKNGRNEKDLFKAIHYVVLMIAAERRYNTTMKQTDHPLSGTAYAVSAGLEVTRPTRNNKHLGVAANYVGPGEHI